jgi:DedD protein
VNEILKQRLVGALILIALGVVFWPIIFVEPGDITADEGRRFPARPAVNTEPIAAPGKENLRQSPEPKSRKEAELREIELEKAALVASAAVAAKPAPDSQEKNAGNSATASADLTADSKHKTRTEAPVKPQIDSEGVPIAWILQVASVSKPEKAEELRGQLLELGHKAYVKKIHRSGQVLLRVYIGPKFERARLDRIKAGIDAEFGVQSMIIRYLP